MKLTILGGAGVRAPFMIGGLVSYAERLDLREVWLMDIDEPKLALIGGLCRRLAERQNAPFTLHLTTDARAALTGAAHIITTIRVGGEQGRIFDERIALRHGVLGQETTGAGGFAMAMRSIPAILDYCALAEEVAPGAWLHNFTNPAGLVTQALRARGYERTIGVCDSANAAQHMVADFLAVPDDAVQTEVFGLNHLSWARSAVVSGEERLPALLRDPAFLAEGHLKLFDPVLIDWLGMYLNEYLWYYYYRDRALAAILGEEETRGEQVARLTRELMERLRATPDPDEAIRVHSRIMAERSASYMAYAASDAEREPELTAADLAQTEERQARENLGYAGVTLGCIEAIERDEVLRTALNIPNAGAIEGMRDDDVVEVTCFVDRDGPHPTHIGAIPDHERLLMGAVKRYERLAVEAILTHDRTRAVEALFEHPLVGSWPLAESLVAAYLEAHAPYIGEWA